VQAQQRRVSDRSRAVGFRHRHFASCLSTRNSTLTSESIYHWTRYSKVDVQHGGHSSVRVDAQVCAILWHGVYTPTHCLPGPSSDTFAGWHRIRHDLWMYVNGSEEVNSYKYQLIHRLGVGAAYGTAKSGIGIAGVGTFRPDLIMKVQKLDQKSMNGTH